ncbi:helix-turn-helix domain-containing protein [Achromobacter marplatensis]|uniref:helix-turn-helix domain-containing protein n=1 Tax=Achromobacter marplatensis TaxID=470868 RepID=UPI0036F2A9AA
MRGELSLRGGTDDHERPLSEALRLIELRKYSAPEIVYIVGHSDPAHFTRAFKRWTGLAPSRFRPALHNPA